MTSNFWMLILGSVLAFSGGLIAFFIQQWWGARKHQSTVKELLTELLRAFNRLAPKIREHYERTGVAWIDLLQQLSESITVYERNREHIIAIKDKTIRADVWDWFLSARACVVLAVNAASSLVKNPDDEWAKGEVGKQIQKLKDLEREAGNLADKIRPR